jgi:hypothetical protein
MSRLGAIALSLLVSHNTTPEKYESCTIFSAFGSINWLWVTIGSYSRQHLPIDVFPKWQLRFLRNFAKVH